MVDLVFSRQNQPWVSKDDKYIYCSYFIKATIKSSRYVYMLYWFYQFVCFAWWKEKKYNYSSTNTNFNVEYNKIIN